MGDERKVCFERAARDASFYKERTDRNIGWITEEEQDLLRRTTIGVAGCGGMGGLLAERFVRLGIGELRIADSEVFDISNINRQFGAGLATVGASKALETAKLLRGIADDYSLIAYPAGITEDMAADFVSGCAAICDEIEFWCVGSRILLHQHARRKGVPLFVGDTVGFGAHLFCFMPNGITIEECLEFGYDEAKLLEDRIRSGIASQAEILRVMEAMVRIFFFEWQEYCANDSSWKSYAATRDRLFQEKKGAIVATNPCFAAGFVADRVLLYLLEKYASVRRSIVSLPEMPGYLYMDAATMIAKTVRGKWW